MYLPRIRIRQARPGRSAALDFTGLPCHVVMAGSASAAHDNQIEWAVSTLRAKGFETHSAIIDGDAENVLSEYIETHPST